MGRLVRGWGRNKRYGRSWGEIGVVRKKWGDITDTGEGVGVDGKLEKRWGDKKKKAMKGVGEPLSVKEK